MTWFLPNCLINKIQQFFRVDVKYHMTPVSQGRRQEKTFKTNNCKLEGRFSKCLAEALPLQYVW